MLNVNAAFICALDVAKHGIPARARRTTKNCTVTGRKGRKSKGVLNRHAKWTYKQQPKFTKLRETYIFIQTQLLYIDILCTCVPPNH